MNEIVEALKPFEEQYDIDLIPMSHQLAAQLSQHMASPASSSSDGYLIWVRPLKDESLSGSPVHGGVGSPYLSANGESSEAIYQKSGALNIPSLIKNAEILFRAGEYPLCRNILKAILATGQKSMFAHYWMGRCFEEEKQFELAKDQYQSSIAYQPSIETYQRLADILKNLGRHIERAEALERALLIKNISANLKLPVMINAAKAWKDAQRLDRSLRLCEQALEIDPKSAEALVSHAWILLRLARIADARAQFEAVLQIAPAHAEANAGLGQCHLLTGSIRDAHDSFAASLDIELNNPEILAQLIRCAMDLKSYVVAARIMGTFADKYPCSPNQLYSLAALQYHLKRMDHARKTLSKLFAIDPNHRQALDLVGLIDKMGGLICQ